MNFGSTLLLLIKTLSITLALVCYESTDNDQVVLGSRTDWSTCVGSLTSGSATLRFFGVTPFSDALIPNYREILAAGNEDPLYAIQDVCIYEEYNIEGKTVIFRCMCMTDGCNSPDKMTYLKKMNREPIPLLD